MASLLPQAPGLLPKWLGLIGSIALLNGASSQVSTKGALSVYDRAPAASVSPLAARLFGIWTFTSGVVRAYAAYHIHEPSVYYITLWTFVIVFLHFSSELLLFKTVTLNKGTIPPLIISVVSLAWMLLQRDFYLN